MSDDTFPFQILSIDNFRMMSIVAILRVVSVLPIWSLVKPLNNFGENLSYHYVIGIEPTQPFSVHQTTALATSIQRQAINA